MTAAALALSVTMTYIVLALCLSLVGVGLLRVTERTTVAYLVIGAGTGIYLVESAQFLFGPQLRFNADGRVVLFLTGCLIIAGAAGLHRRR
ncbi:hypothetical protein HISP_13025 [Haloarcula hispanica N601]|uniref:Uncharacterized protein n=1 Tax=Haloarcula hispanica N601 TaxID=1417673 RepID=V5TSF7_HALHI|nr:hypothetical protein HISP_13025 [Haloarcula hispanica N601]